jgi:hypothetical protein
MARFGQLMRTAGALLTLSTLTPMTTGCSGDDCRAEADAAKKFLNVPANRACQTSDDCAVVSTGCSGLGFCGQAQLNKNTAAGEAWRSREKLLRECTTECLLCGAAVTPTCTDGFCGSEL